MSERTRGDFGSALVLSVAVAFFAMVLLTFVAGISAQNAYRIAAGQDRAERYESCRQTSERSAIPLLFDPCSPAEPEAGEDTKTSEYDLAAQNRMADWAALLAVLSLVSLVISAFGIWLVKRTFDKTSEAVAAAQQANNIAERNMFADKRPWVSLSEIKVANIQLTPDGHFALLATAKPLNTGKTPALRVELHTELTDLNQLERFEDEESLEAFCERCRRTVTLGRNRALFPNDPQKPLVSVANKEGFDASNPPVGLRLYLCATYMSPDDRYKVMHIGALVSLDIERTVPMPGSPEPANRVGAITVRDLGNLSSVS